MCHLVFIHVSCFTYDSLLSVSSESFVYVKFSFEDDDWTKFRFLRRRAALVPYAETAPLRPTSRGISQRKKADIISVLTPLFRHFNGGERKARFWEQLAVADVADLAEGDDPDDADDAAGE